MKEHFSGAVSPFLHNCFVFLLSSPVADSIPLCVALQDNSVHVEQIFLKSIHFLSIVAF